MPAANPLGGHRAVVEGKCHDCGGDLLDGTGTHSERLVSVTQTSAYAAAICNECKRAQAKCNKPAPAGTRCRLTPNHKGKCELEEVDDGI